jgi:glutamate-1-semialdehyde aminotransferase
VLPSRGQVSNAADNLIILPWNDLVGGKGPVVQVSLTNQSAILNYRDWARRDTGTYQRIVTELAEQGIRSIPRGTWYVSTEHSEKDVDQTLSKFEDALKVLKSSFRT